MAAKTFDSLAKQMPKGKAPHSPTSRDKDQSTVHHTDSVKFNLAHAITHLQETQHHAQKLGHLADRNPELKPHVKALNKALGGKAK